MYGAAPYAEVAYSEASPATGGSTAGVSIWTACADGSLRAGQSGDSPWTACTAEPGSDWVGCPAGSLRGTNPIKATGGTVTHEGRFTVHTFETVGPAEFHVDAGVGLVELTLVAGGGGGGSVYGTGVNAGGGGGGGEISQLVPVGPGTFVISVGDGGQPGGINPDALIFVSDGHDGDPTTFGAYRAEGGGGGGGLGDYDRGGRPGGCGGGGASANTGSNFDGGAGSQGGDGEPGSPTSEAPAGAGGSSSRTTGGAAGPNTNTVDATPGTGNGGQGGGGGFVGAHGEDHLLALGSKGGSGYVRIRFEAGLA